MRLSFTAEIFYWRGPSPFHFVAVPEAESAELQAISSLVTYGWGMIPVTARIGSTEFTTSLWPKEGTYYLPLKDAVRRAERIGLGDRVTVRLQVSLGYDSAS